MVGRQTLGAIEKMQVFTQKSWNKFLQRSREVIGIGFQDRKRNVDKLDLLVLLVHFILLGIIYIIIRYLIIDGLRHFINGTPTFLFY